MPTDLELEALYASLQAVRRDIENAPERFEHTQAGYLAEADDCALREAQRVIHRLMLWRKHEGTLNMETYLLPLEREKVRADDDWSVKA